MNAHLLLMAISWMLSISCGNANQYYWTREERDEYFAAQKKEQEERVSQDQVKSSDLISDRIKLCNIDENET